MTALQLTAVESGSWKRPVTLSATFSETIVLLGRNGAGKTTLLNTIAGLSRVNAGQLCLDGQNLTACGVEHRVAAGIRIALEGRLLFTRLSVRKNLLLGCYRHAVPGEIEGNMAWALDIFPMLKEKLDVPAGTLSGGQQTQVNICRALMSRPRVLLLDEPTLGLDPPNVRALISAVKQITEQNKVITLIADQNIRLAREFPERLVVMDGGRIIFDGPLRDARLSGVLDSICPH